MTSLFSHEVHSQLQMCALHGDVHLTIIKYINMKKKLSYL